MKTNNLILVIGVLALLISSCKPIYQCGQPVPEKNQLLSKRVKAVISERDSLCKTLELRDSNIVALNENITNLKGNIDGLNQSITDIEKKYNELSGAKLSQAEQFNLALKQKTDELNEKERLKKGTRTGVKRSTRRNCPPGLDYKTAKRYNPECFTGI